MIVNGIEADMNSLLGLGALKDTPGLRANKLFHQRVSVISGGVPERSVSKIRKINGTVIVIWI